ncbi:MAG TPA: hypothetical protein VGK00_04205 [Anaerolineales bacterium]|jgi:hypothetical protein
MTLADLTNSPKDRKIILALAWGVTLLVSNLPDILLNELGNGSPDWLLWVKIAFLVV